MKRGEVWWARIDKRRPVVLLSRDEAYAIRGLVVVAPALPVGAWLFARRVLRRTYHTRRGALGNFATRLAHRLRSALP